MGLIPRWAHRLYAGLFGYFWVPCRGCGRYFGGHERIYDGPRLVRLDAAATPMMCYRCERAEAVKDLAEKGIGRNECSGPRR